MLVKYRLPRSKPQAEEELATPVVGSPDDNVPVSSDVHLYGEPNTFVSKYPMFYADCEGLAGGQTPPRAESLRARKELNETDGRALDAKELRLKMRPRTPRKILWPTSNKQQYEREFAVTQLYPRLLYTFSDVIVFITQVPR